MNHLYRTKFQTSYPLAVFYQWVFFIVFLSGGIQGAEYHWIPGSSGAFTDATKYQEGIAPGDNDRGVFTGGTNFVNNQEFHNGRSVLVTGGNTTFALVQLCDQATFTLDGDDTTTVTANGTIRVGDKAENGPEGTAVLNVHGGTLHAKSWFAVGRANPGRVHLTGGKILLDSANSIQLGDTENASAEIFISGGSFENKSMNFNIGTSKGTSVLIALSGTGNLTSEKILSFSVGENSSSTLQMTGGTLNANDGIQMGQGSNSRAEFNMSGGNATVKDSFFIGNRDPSSASVAVSGGILTSETNILVGKAKGSTGKLMVSGGTLTTKNEIQVGAVAGSTGILEISGGTVTASLIRLNWHVNEADARLIHSGGTTRLSNTFDARGDSLIEVSGGDITVQNMSYWGENTHYIQTGGTVHFSNTLRTGGVGDPKQRLKGTTVLDIAGGTLKGNGWFGIGYDNVSVLNIHTGGTLQQGLISKDSSLVIGDGASATLTLAGGKIEASQLNISNSGTFQLNAASSGFGSIDAASYAKATYGKVQWGINAGVTILDAAAYQNIITSPNAISAFDTGVQGIWNVTKNDTSKAYSAELAEDFRLGETYEDWRNVCLFGNSMDKGWIAIGEEITSLGNYVVALSLESGEGDNLSDLALWMENLLQYDPGLNLASYDEEQNTLTLHGFASELGERFLAFDFSQYNALMGTGFQLTGFSAAAVPEPSTLLLLLAGMVFFAWKKYRR